MSSRRHIKWMGSGLALVFSATLAYLVLAPQDLPTARQIASAEEKWELSQVMSIESDAALSTIASKRLWGSAGMPGGAVAKQLDEAPLTPPDWRIAGVFIERGRPTLLVATDGVPLPTPLSVGDKLPGGAEILAISSDRICLSIRGKRASVSTYQQ
jgi:hypothetical protein